MLKIRLPNSHFHMPLPNGFPLFDSDVSRVFFFFWLFASLSLSASVISNAALMLSSRFRKVSRVVVKN